MGIYEQIARYKITIKSQTFVQDFIVILFVSIDYSPIARSKTAAATKASASAE